jgi:Flp pilus assembly protein TadG
MRTQASIEPPDGRRLRGDRGSSDALGMALIAPAALGLAIVILFLGRSVDSRATVQVAAESGAQAAAQERTHRAAVTAGTAAATAMLVDEDTCSTPRVVVDTAQFAPGGVVRVTVSCTVSTSGLELINPPSPDALTATAIATIDPFRAAEGGD